MNCVDKVFSLCDQLMKLNGLRRKLCADLKKKSMIMHFPVVSKNRSSKPDTIFRRNAKLSRSKNSFSGD